MLFIVRHAWAEDRSEAYPNDDLRPLTKAGRKRFRKVVKRMAERGFAPQLIAVSPLVRCRETAEIVAEFVCGEPKVTVVEALSPGSSLEPLLSWTRDQGAVDVAWVGHAPDVGELTAALIGDGRAALRFGKGAIAAIDFDGPIAAGAGELRWFVTADVLNC